MKISTFTSITLLIFTVFSATAQATWTHGNITVYTQGGLTNGNGYSGSGWQAAVEATGKSVVSDLSPGSSSFDQGTLGITNHAGTTTISTSTSNGFISGSSGSGLYIEPPHDYNGGYSYTITINFTTPLYEFGFDLIDIYDCDDAGDGPLQYDVKVDGQSIWKTSNDVIGASNKSNISVMDGDGVVRTSHFLGQNRESFIGFISTDAVSSVTITVTATSTIEARDWHGMDSFRWGQDNTCNDNQVRLSLTFDNYPEETSWQIRDASDAVVASGGSYDDQADESTMEILSCLPDGCYTFEIFDVWSDGICCSWGDGSYTLIDNSNTILASGASFGSSESTAFCLGGGAGTLPIELTYFEAKAKENLVELEWITAMEDNNNYFEIERSADGQNWEVIDIIKSQGNSTSDQFYATADVNPLSGISYYRLKQTDYDETFSYSDLQSVEFTSVKNTGFNVFPIPASDFVNVTSNQDIEAGNISISNSMGALITVPATSASNNSIRFDISQLQAGMYFLTIKESNNIQTRKFYVQ